MTSKEALERIENFIDGSPITKEYRESLNANVKVIEKDLEILEIIEKYPLLISGGIFRYTSYKNYKANNNSSPVTKDEFEKLYEWLIKGE